MKFDLPARIGFPVIEEKKSYNEAQKKKEYSSGGVYITSFVYKKATRGEDVSIYATPSEISGKNIFSSTCGYNALEHAIRYIKKSGENRTFEGNIILKDCITAVGPSAQLAWFIATLLACGKKLRLEFQNKKILATGKLDNQLPGNIGQVADGEKKCEYFEKVSDDEIFLIAEGTDLPPNLNLKVFTSEEIIKDRKKLPSGEKCIIKVNKIDTLDELLFISKKNYWLLSLSLCIIVIVICSFYLYKSFISLEKKVDKSEALRLYDEGMNFVEKYDWGNADASFAMALTYFSLPKERILG